jgi:hypothetical protein
MDRLQSLLDRKGLAAGLAAAIGLLVGLGLAWGVWPVRWVDATPDMMRADMRVDYMRAVIDSYSVNRDADLAVQRYQLLGGAGQEAFQTVVADPKDVSEDAIQSFNSLLEIYESELTPATPVPESAGALATRLILPVCGVTALLGLGTAALLFVRGRSGGARSARSARRERAPRDGMEPGPEEPIEQPVEPRGAAAGAGAIAAQDPLATFRTIYSLGDDLYDDSFSIESAAGDFLGECGVGIGDTIGVGDPKKVSAFEIWLFDKNDIQTVTKVVMSRYAFGDDATRTRLAAKGDPTQAQNGAVITLETASLEVEARIVDMIYGESALPGESFFERMTIELRAWPRAGG